MVRGAGAALSRQGDGRGGRALDITVSAGEQTYTLPAFADLINAGVRMVQPDIVKMGGITGLMRCAALCHAHGVELVPHQTQPTVGHMANLHICAASVPGHQAVRARTIPSVAPSCAVRQSAKPVDGLFHLPAEPGLGLRINETELAKRCVPIG